MASNSKPERNSEGKAALAVGVATGVFVLGVLALYAVGKPPPTEVVVALAAVLGLGGGVPAHGYAVARGLAKFGAKLHDGER